MHRRRHVPYITEKQLLDKYPWLTSAMIKKYLPQPQPGLNKANPYCVAWMKHDVEKIIESVPALKSARDRAQKEARTKKEQENALNAFIAQFTPENMFERAKELDRHFILHVGPTNSGKTYQALEALKQADLGVYLGPLRLLALEVFDKLNIAECFCSLLTGEESIPVPFSTVTASTIEMADYREHYDVAVIDEAQMIADPDRGPHWLESLCRLDADEVHVCLAPEAQDLIESIVGEFDPDYEVVSHKRLTPLVLGDPVHSFKDIRDGDAVIAFSRKAVLGLAGSLEKRGMNPSVIYGSLPPDARREEVRKYVNGETTVVVATDAIGMGISLPIRRVVFSAMAKFDGTKVRPLTSSEILQIAGRAGRFGMYDIGEVTATQERGRVKRALETMPESVSKIRIAFPVSEAINSSFSIEQLLKAWQNLPKTESYARENMSESLVLLKKAAQKRISLNREDMFRMITCPVDTDSDPLVAYWARCASAIARRQPVPVPDFPEDTLEDCELQYRALDLYHQVVRRYGQEDFARGMRTETLDRIMEFLQTSKKDYIRSCTVCNRELPIGSTFSVCRACRGRMNQF